MENTVHSETPDTISSRNSLEEEPQTGEILEGKQHEGEDDNSQGEDSEEPSAAAAPNHWRRLRNVLLIFAAFWLAVTLLRATSSKRPSKVIYANRYSENYKFRPAASPIVTERLQDGRTRIRGAEPTARSAAPVEAKLKSKSRKRRTSKQKKAKSGK